MESSQDDFAALRALLKLKRHEQPPPRYFDDARDQIHHRLRGPEGVRRQSILSLLGFEGSLKPAFFYGLGVTCCVGAMYAVVCLLAQDPPSEAGGAQALNLTVPSSLDGASMASSSHLLAPEAKAGEPSASTNPVMSAGGLLMVPVDGYRLRVTPASYTPNR